MIYEMEIIIATMNYISIRFKYMKEIPWKGETEKVKDNK